MDRFLAQQNSRYFTAEKTVTLFEKFMEQGFSSLQQRFVHAKIEKTLIFVTAEDGRDEEEKNRNRAWS